MSTLPLRQNPFGQQTSTRRLHSGLLATKPSSIIVTGLRVSGRKQNATPHAFSRPSNSQSTCNLKSALFTDWSHVESQLSLLGLRTATSKWLSADVARALPILCFALLDRSCQEDGRHFLYLSRNQRRRFENLEPHLGGPSLRATRTSLVRPWCFPCADFGPILPKPLAVATRRAPNAFSLDIATAATTTAISVRVRLERQHVRLSSGTGCWSGRHKY